MEPRHSIPFLASLRNRYAITAVFLAIVTISFSILGFYTVHETQRDSAQSVELRNQIVQQSIHIRDAVWKTQRALESFLLAPHQSEHITAFNNSLDVAIASTNTLLTNPWVVSHDLSTNIISLERILNELKHKGEHLIETRLDSARQFPTLAIGGSILEPLHSQFVSANSLAIREIETDGGNPLVYRAFVQARHTWMQMVNIFRMYLANRIGSFSESSMPEQVSDINLYHDELVRLLAKLEKMNHEGKVELQGVESLTLMKNYASEWHNGFKKVVDLHQSDNWRADKGILQNDIHPGFLKAWNALMTLDIKTVAEANNDITTLAHISTLQSNTMWIFGVVAIALIALGYIVLDKAILTPISTLTRALQLEASGETNLALPQARLSETQNLVDAFKEMRRQVHTRQAELEHQALHDSLTGLPNRTLLLDRLNQAIVSARRAQSNPTLLIMDLDFFKDVNDSLGHSIGDKLLYQIGNLIKYNLRAMDTVARLGGDEFAILLTDTSDKKAKVVARKIITLLSRPFIIEKQSIQISASIGIAIFPAHGDSSEEIIKHADAAMYMAKRNKLGYALYDPLEDNASVHRLRLIADLKYAIKQNKLELYYQPKIDLKTGKVLGAEALLRWKREEGFIPPDELVALAEQTGQINNLTRWVINTACRQQKHWQDDGVFLNVSINISAHNLQNKELVSHVQQSLHNSNVEPRYLTLEVTESAMMANPQFALRNLERLHELGLRLSIDDFGTGFSSLSYLKQLPVSELKIDRSFVMDIIDDKNDAVIVRSTIALAHNLGLTVVAEGVENQEIRDVLMQFDCDEAQGYHISKPIPANEFKTWYHAFTTGDPATNSRSV